MSGGTLKVPDFRRHAEATRRLDAVIAASPAPSHMPDSIILRQGSTLEPEPVSWLWPTWLARGKLHVLAGPPGQGKTTIALAVAAVCTAGGQWPDGSRCEAGNVLIWSGEDDAKDTLVPRLIAAGADRSRVYFIEGTRIDGKAQPFDPARDLGRLAEIAERIGDVSVLIVDPVVSAVAGDGNSNTEVRRSLQPLVDLGAMLNAAVIGISHFTKGGAGKDPVERVTGSLAFGAVARVVLCAVKVKSDDDEQRRILARAKSNIGPDEGGFEYRIEHGELPDHPGIGASRVVWGAAVDGSARELLADAEAEVDAKDEQRDAAGFLEGLLIDGPMTAKSIFAEASGAGYSRDQMHRAGRRLRIEKRKAGMSGGWVWALGAAEDGAKVVKVAAQRLLQSSQPSPLPSDDAESF